MKKKHKTYAESQGEKPFDWNKFLAKKTIKDYEWSDACDLSQKWVTCACGNQCTIIPRHASHGLFYTIGEPEDKKLSNLGFEFHEAIEDRRVEAAKSILKKIEARSAWIIAKIKAKK